MWSSRSIFVVTRGASARLTRIVVRPSSLPMTSPYFDRSGAPSSSVTLMVLVAANWSARAASAPSNRIRPWWITITRLHSAWTSAM